MTAQFRSKVAVCTAQVNPDLRTHHLFDVTFRESTESPINEFMRRLTAINMLSPQPSSFDPLQGQLVLLGVIAAVESYLRTLCRRLIVLDDICQTSVIKQDVSFGAAMHLSREMLPEALLERISFISRGSIEDTLKDLLGVKGGLPSDLDVAIGDYARVCHLRHCAVHRFGKLGVGNAVFLGLEDHKELLEKPLKLDYAALQSAIAISTCFVKTLNNFLFNEMISRRPAGYWSSHFGKDRKSFTAYYNLFADTVSVTGATAAIRPLYDQFVSQLAAFRSR